MTRGEENLSYLWLGRLLDSPVLLSEWSVFPSSNVEATGEMIPTAAPKRAQGVPVIIIRTDEVKVQE